MKRNQWIASVLSIVIAAGSMFQTPVVQAADTGAGETVNQEIGTTYYVSSVNGDDANPGTSQDEPFQSLSKINEITLGPGDQVLLEKGSVFDSQYLHIKEGSKGSEAAPIIISTYGDGARPQINANGTGVWYQSYGQQLGNAQHKWQGNVSSAVLLKDVEYIEISGLEITNDRDRGELHPEDAGKPWNGKNVMDRTGVAGMTQNIGTADHIVLDDLYVHDVDGNVYNKHMLNGGIYFIAALPTNETQTGIPRYNDLQITNCHVENVYRWGIAAAYTAYWGKFTTAELSDDIMKQYGHSNVVISNNYIKDAGGDAITTMYCDRPLVENNVSDGAAKYINTTDYNATDFGRVAAAIWPWKCKNAVFQYNECFDTKNAGRGNGDGQAWDADSGDGTLYQYNYSHGNSGGAVMFCLQQAVNSTFRYNISQNDMIGPLNIPSNPDAHIYNNTFYIAQGVPLIRPDMKNGAATIENNIIYYSGTSPKTETWYTNNRITYDNNLYYNYSNKPSGDTNAIQVSAGTPVLADPGTAPTAVSVDGTARPHSNPAQNTVFDGYKLAEDSPAIDKGKVITDANGFAVEKDFFGNTITTIPEIGAAEYVGTLISTMYMTDEESASKVIYVPFTAKNPTMVSEFLSNITVSETSKVTVLRDGSELSEKDLLSGGEILRITAGNNAVSEYTVKQKNEYHWALDFAGPQQGNVWFGQMRVGNGAWTNIMTYDPTFPNWQVEQFYGPGITGATHSTPITENTQGLLSAPNGDTQTAMTFRAPKTGIVSFKVKRGVTKPAPNSTVGDEPYLRKSGNTGTVTLSLLVNGEQKQSVTLSTSFVSAAGWKDFDNIEVRQGDYIRVVAKSTNATQPSLHITPIITYQDAVIEDIIPPSAPTDVNVSDITATGAKITWTASTDNIEVAGYNLYYENEDKELTPINTELITRTEYELTGLTPETTYRIVVEAVDTSDNKEQAEAVAVTTTKDTTAPDAPTNVMASDITATGLKITWDASADNVKVAGYNLYYQGENAELTLINQDGVIEETEYTLTGLTPETTYQIVVEAVDTSDNKAQANAVEVTTSKDTTAPTAPGNVNVTEVTLTSAKITWTASTDNVKMAGYNLYYQGEDQELTLINTAGVIEETEYTLTGLTPETTYQIVVEAVDEAGNIARARAVEVVTLEDTEAPDAPTNVKASEITETSAKITWTASTDNIKVAGYNIYVDDVQVNRDLVTGTEYTLTDLKAGSTYKVVVEAVDTSNNTQKSEAGTVKTVDTTSPSVPSEVTVGNITHNSAEVTWQESTDNVGVSGYNIYLNDKKVNGETVKELKYELTGLEADTEYRVKVEAVDEAGNKAESREETFTTLEAPDEEGPSAPTNVTASDVTETSVKITWTASTDNVEVAGYNIYVDGAKVNESLVTATEYMLTDLKAGTEYKVVVEAVDTSNNTQKSEAATVETVDITAPDAPTNVEASEITETGAKITWTASTDNVEVAGYNIYVDEAKINESLVTVTEYTLTDLKAGTEYKVVVEAVDTSSNTQSSEAVTVKTVDTMKPSSPSEVAVGKITHNSAEVTWQESTDNVGVTGYNVYLNGEKVNDIPVAEVKYDLTDLIPETEYRVKVEALDEAGNKAESEEVKFTTIEAPDEEAPTAPSGLAIHNITHESAEVTWKESTDNVGVTGYNIYLNNKLVNTSPVTELRCELTALEAETEYQVKVEALDEAGNTSVSDPISFTTKTAPDNEAPTAPGGVAVSSITDNSAVVSWTASTDNVGVAGYNIYLNDNKINALPVTELQFQLTGLAAETEYQVRIEAVDGAGNTSSSGSISFATEALQTSDNEAPTVPSGVAVSGITESTAVVSWTESTDNVGVAGYNIYLNDNKINALPITELKFQLTGLTAETEYQVKVEALDEAGNSSISNPVSFVTGVAPDREAPTKPDGITISDITHNSAVVMWNESTDNVGVVGYNIYLNDVKVNASPITGQQANISETNELTTSVLRYELGGLEAATEYQVKIEAVDAVGNTSVSDVVRFTTVTFQEPGDQRPTAPGNLTTVEVMSESISISWRPAGDNEGVVGYNVYVNGQRMNTTAITDTQYVLTGLTADTTYEIMVTAVNGVGNESEAALLTVKTDAMAAPEVPSDNPSAGPSGDVPTGSGGNVQAPTADNRNQTVKVGDTPVALEWGAVFLISAGIIMMIRLKKRQNK